MSATDLLVPPSTVGVSIDLIELFDEMNRETNLFLTGVAAAIFGPKGTA